MNDTLKIFNGDSINAPLIGNYCGQKVPPRISSNGPALHLRIFDFTEGSFFATYSVVDSGWSTEQICMVYYIELF